MTLTANPTLPRSTPKATIVPPSDATQVPATATNPDTTAAGQLLNRDRATTRVAATTESTLATMVQANAGACAQELWAVTCATF